MMTTLLDLSKIQGMKIPSYTQDEIRAKLSKKDLLEFLIGMYGDEIMSRKIKFRGVAKDLKNIDVVPHKGIFVYGNLVHDESVDGLDYIVGNMVEADEEYCTLHFWEPIEKGSAERFTGLKDAKGQEIYEGDIIKYYGANKSVKVGTTYGRVFYDSQHGCFNSRIQNKEHGKGGISPFNDLVIGNIHENPELLEVAK